MPEHGWFDAVEAVVLKPLRTDIGLVPVWNANNTHQLQQLVARGQISASDDMRKNMLEVLLYQRSHADAMRTLFELHGSANSARRFVVYDVGCGAGTAAIALAEAISWDRATFDYIGVDHNPNATFLGMQLVAEPNVCPPGARFGWHSNVVTAAAQVQACLTAESVPVVTSSYLFRQQALTAAFLDQYAEATAAIVSKCTSLGLQAWMFGVDATGGPYSRLESFLSALATRKVSIQHIRRDVVSHASEFIHLFHQQHGRTKNVYNGSSNLERWVFKLGIETGQLSSPAGS